MRKVKSVRLVFTMMVAIMRSRSILFREIHSQVKLNFLTTLNVVVVLTQVIMAEAHLRYLTQSQAQLALKSLRSILRSRFQAQLIKSRI